MSLLQLIYYSENRLGHSRKAEHIAELQQQCIANNLLDGVTGVLLHDDLWFVQLLEGPLQRVVGTYQRIVADRRHVYPVTIYKSAITKRSFANWTMGFAMRTPQNANLFGRHWFDEDVLPRNLAPDDVIALMHDLAEHGHLDDGTGLPEQEMLLAS